MVDSKTRFNEPMYRVCRLITLAFIRGIFRISVENVEFVPIDGPCIIASNHANNIDPFLVGASVDRFVEFMAKDELFHIPVVSRIVRYLGAFPIRRGSNDKAAFKYAVDVPKQDGCLVIFPEGHRSKNGQIGKGMPGVALIARRARCPVVPCAIVGTYGFRTRLVVRFGPPIIPSPDDTNDSLLGKLMEQIQFLHGRRHVSNS